MTDRNCSATLSECGSAGFIKNRCVQWVFVLSCFAMSVLIKKPTVIYLIVNVFAFAVMYYLTFRMRILEHIFCRFSRKTFCAALVFALFAVGYYVPRFMEWFPALLDYLPAAPAHLAVFLLYLTTAPVFFVFFYAFISRFSAFVAEIHKTSDPIERCFFLAIMLIAAVTFTVVYNQTNVFYSAFEIETGRHIHWDVVYTYDSRYYFVELYYYPAYLAVHRPVLYLFFLPFVITADIFSRILFFIPNSFPVLLGVIQTALAGLVTLFLSRLMQLRGLSKMFFFTFFTISYSTLLNALTFDGYIASTFWLVVFLYVFLKNSKTNCDYAYIAASGNLLVAGVCIFFYLRISELKKSMIHIIRVLFSLFVFVLIFNTALFGSVFRALTYYRDYTGVQSPLSEKLLQYVNFISSCFIKPETIVDAPILNRLHPWMSYQLAPAESLNFSGLAFLALCLLGFVFNSKDKFVKICAFWAALSFFILCIIGWGTPENGLILYSMYFGWAYFCLAFLAVEKLLQKQPGAKYAVYAASIAALAYINIPGMYDLIQFGIKYYPCQ